MSAIAPCRVAVMRLRWAPTRRASRDEERQQGEREHRQAPVEQEHRHDGRGDRRDVGDDRGRRGGHHGLHAADVVGDARLDLAGARAREEGEREPLQVAVDLRAQVVHHALADEVRQPGLRDADDAGDDRDGDHPADQPAAAASRSFSGIAWSRTSRSRNGETIPSPRRDDDQPEDAAEPRAVRAEQRAVRRHAPRLTDGDAAASGDVSPRRPRPLMRARPAARARAPARAPRRWSSPGGTSSARARPRARRRGRRGCARAGSRR